MILKAITFVLNWYKRFKKICRSFYYFRKLDVFVHGKINIGKRKNITVGEKCSVNKGVVLQGFNDIRIGKRVVLSVNCMILDGNLDHEAMIKTGKRDHIASYVHLGDYVWVGAGAIILPGVSIGDRSVIGAGSVVMNSFPEDVLVAGNPAKVIKRLR